MKAIGIGIGVAAGVILVAIAVVKFGYWGRRSKVKRALTVVEKVFAVDGVQDGVVIGHRLAHGPCGVQKGRTQWTE
jgi:predicted small secreted protein